MNTKKITRIDEWMKEFGFYEDFEQATLQKCNFAPWEWVNNLDVMRAKVKIYIDNMEARKEPLQDQLIGSFVLTITPQGGDFWNDIYGYLVKYENLSNNYGQMKWEVLASSHNLYDVKTQAIKRFDISYWGKLTFHERGDVITIFTKYSPLLNFRIIKTNELWNFVEVA